MIDTLLCVNFGFSGRARPGFGGKKASGIKMALLFLGRPFPLRRGIPQQKPLTMSPNLTGTNQKAWAASLRSETNVGETWPLLITWGGTGEGKMFSV